MKIVALVKQTFDTEAKIQLSENNTQINSQGVKQIINPYDEYAVEEALQIKSKFAASEVVVLSLGPAASKERIIRALAMGADRAVLVSDEGINTTDSLSVAKVLAKAIEAENPDIVFTGKQAIDDDNMHIPGMVAELLGWPHVNVVTKFEATEANAIVHREIEGGQTEVYEVSFPAVIGAHKSLNSPRYASLPGIMKAKKKPFDQKTASDLGLSLDSLNSQIEVESYGFPAEKPEGKMFQEEPVQEMVSKVLKALKEEAKVL